MLEHLIFAIAYAATSSSIALATTEPIALDLLCRGRAEKIEYGDTDILTGEDAVVSIHLAGASSTASFPRLIEGELHKSLRIKDLEETGREIKGEVWYGKIG